jgi:hypothetical protein
MAAVIQGGGSGIDTGLKNNNLQPENEPKVDVLTAEERKAYHAANFGQPAAPRPERPHIPLGTQLVPGGPVPDESRPYHPSPSFDIGVLEGIDGWADHKDHVPGATSALGSAHEALKQIDEAYAVLQKDTGKNADQKLAVLSVSAEKRFDAVYAAIGTSIQNIHKGIANHEAELSKPYTDKGGSKNSEEVRGMLRAMPEKQRRETISKAVADGNDLVLGAVLGVDPFLTLSNPLEHRLWQRQLAERRHPELVKRIQVMRKAAETLGRATGALTQEFELAMRGSFAKGKKIEAHSNESAIALAKLRGERLV